VAQSEDQHVHTTTLVGTSCRHSADRHFHITSMAMAAGQLLAGQEPQVGDKCESRDGLCGRETTLLMMAPASLSLRTGVSDVTRPDCRLSDGCMYLTWLGLCHVPGPPQAPVADLRFRNTATPTVCVPYQPCRSVSQMHPCRNRGTLCITICTWMTKSSPS
jgi:hypothetical protein